MKNREKSTMKKKLLYIMHIDWKFIKQRPHFIAEGLSEVYDITIVHFCSKQYLFKNFDNSTRNQKNLNILPAIRLPLYENKVIYGLNKSYLELYFKFLIKKYDPDFIWITFPQLYDYIPPNTGCKIIYDCMDEATRFGFKNYFKSKILELEKKLVEDASVIFVPSNHFMENLIEKYRCRDKFVLVRNAFGGEIIDTKEADKKRETFKIGYIGVISEMIDFENVKITLDKFKNIEYHFIGPYELKERIKHDRIIYYGQVPYDELYNYVKDYNCLIVPFKLNESVKIADPVKIYGYINYNKPIISVYFKELDRFSQFIHFYSNIEELIDLLKQIIENSYVKYSYSDRIKFLENNSWDSRIYEILKQLDRL
jgi:teichuronic acid biosynthesis glycosyltransferase TuaH